MNDLRLIWSEDQYLPLGPGLEAGSFYFGRTKGNDYNVYLRAAGSSRKRLVQTLRIQDEEEFYWCRSANKLTLNPIIGSEVEKIENLLSGYTYNGHRDTRLKDLSLGVKVIEQVLDCGAEVIWLLPSNAIGWIASLHGGPECYESLEIRYGGLYRELLTQGNAIAILNYRGSLGLRSKTSQSIWGSWKAAILEDFNCLISSAEVIELPQLPKVVFGVSFGGALALILGANFSIPKIVLSSPLLDIQNQKNRGGEELLCWFNSRFSALDMQDFSFNCLVERRLEEVFVHYSSGDEVLGSEMFLKLENEKKDDSGWNFFSDCAGHAPQGYSETRKRFESILENFD